MRRRGMRLPGAEDLAVLVVGGAGGIGEAICRTFLRDTARVVVADVPGETLDAVASSLEESAGSAGVWAVGCDVTSETSVRDAVARSIGFLGHIDVLVNCAGVTGSRSNAIDTDLADWNSVIQVNLTGAFLTAKYVCRHFIPRGSGAIVNIGSTAGKLPRIGQSPYCVSKAGIEQLTRVLALELAPHGIRVNAVCPGATRTPFLRAAANAEGVTEEQLTLKIVRGDLESHRVGIPLGRLAVPADHAELVVFLASPAVRHMTGQVIYVDGGEAMC